MDAEELYVEQIKELETKLAQTRVMLESIRRTKRRIGMPDMRFFGSRPVDAASVILQERGERVKRDQVVELILAGGYAKGLKNPRVNIRRSFEQNIALGNLIEDGEYLDIPR
jgi:hypothetical protein